MLVSGKKISAVVGGLAGSLDRNREVLVNGLNIASWIGKPVKKELEKEFQSLVVLENDAALAGLGEAVDGAGKEHEIVAYITVSTGVGGARITNKRIDARVYGFEPGFQIIDAGHGLCAQCVKPYLNVHISGRGMEKRCGKKPEDISDPAVWDDVAKHLSLGLHNTIVHWSPDIVVLGGSVMKSISMEQVRIYLKETLKVYPEIPLIEPALLDDLGGLHGALHLARTQYSA